MSELYIPQPRPTINKANGRFLPGHVPANKGKKWDEYMTEDAKQNCMKGWINMNKYRNNRRFDVSKRGRKAIVAISDDGSVRMFPYADLAAVFIGGNKRNVRRCCQENSKGKDNTDHRYYKIRFYFESDFKIWKSKYRQA